MLPTRIPSLEIRHNIQLCELSNNLLILLLNSINQFLKYNTLAFPKLFDFSFHKLDLVGILDEVNRDVGNDSRGEMGEVDDFGKGEALRGRELN